MSTGFNFITKNNSPYVLDLYIDGNNNNCLDTDYISPNPYLGQTFTINPHSSFTAKLFRKDGHGCNGKQGVFQARPTFVINNKTFTGAYEGFNFDAEGGIASDGYQVDYGSQLSQANQGADATWTITVFG
ncbi:MAG TPA: hypothetical protein VK777_26795 [Reyranella sp.]|jgi:hypothetical protein|nr:hypothetical protein [Reyranella sp.]